MHVLREEDGSFVISDVEGALQEILCAIPAAAEPDDNRAACERLFPDPTPAGEPETAREEWREYVEPELRHLFEDAMATVETDLEPLAENGKFVSPSEHIDAWLNGLNQARLVLAARYNVTEEDMTRNASMVQTERDFALFQIEVYGFLQECLIRGLE